MDFELSQQRNGYRGLAIVRLGERSVQGLG
jgi:hypothetical protein